MYRVIAQTVSDAVWEKHRPACLADASGLSWRAFPVSPPVRLARTESDMARLRRRENKRICRPILRGADPDGITPPLGNCKPHVYYW